MLNALKNKINQLAEKAEEAAFAADIEWEKIKISEEERNVRYDICKKCEWLFAPTNTCKKCGCFMAVKTYLPYQSCPIGKWKDIPIISEFQETPK